MAAANGACDCAKYHDADLCSAFDQFQFAFCPGNHEVHILNWNGSAWSKDCVLDEHDQVVTSIDWAPKTNRIVTCSEDRNAYVWTSEGGKWKPTLVLLRINRAATHVKWSPNEDKFAVASGAKVVSVCYYSEDEDWWVSKHIKKHKSTVLHVDWHPNNILLLTASSDFKCRIFSAFVKEVEKRPTPPVLAFDGKFAFGELLAELDTSNGWVKSCKWSPSGERCAFVGHDSSISFANCAVNPPAVVKVKHGGLPFQALLWVNESTVVAGGHDRSLFVFRNEGPGKWSAGEDMGKGAAKPAAAAKAGGGSAMNMWKNKVDRGENARTGTTLSTKHQNCINQISSVSGQQLASTGIDGRVVFWKSP